MYRIKLIFLFLIVSNLVMGQTTWYTLASGDWNDSDIWTLDPAGAISVNPSSEYPDAGTDNVVIKSGKVITVPAAMNLTLGTVKIEGSLDLNTSSGHTFDKLRGSGKIFLQGDGFPSITTDDSHFTTLGRGAGTVVFEGNSFSFGSGSSYTFCHIEVNMNTGNTVQFINDITANGNLRLEGGTLQIGSTGSTKYDLTITGDITVDSDAYLTVGTGASGTAFNDYHNIYCSGDIVNDGSIKLTNQSQPDYDSYATNGGAIFTMQGSSNNSFTCNNTTDLYRLVVDKGSDMTYVVTLSASAQGNFRLYGRNDDSGLETKALYIKNGTLKLMGSLFIPTLTEGSSDFEIPTTGQLWLASSGVTVYSTALSDAETSVGGIQGVGVDTGTTGAQSLSVKGKLRITDGLLNTKTHGTVVWDDGNAVVQVEGGTVNTAGLRSGGGSTGVYSYIQSGGTVTMYGEINTDGIEDVAATFSIKGSDNGFIMSGGTLEIDDANYVTAAGYDRAFEVESAIGNYSVTGGTVRFNRVSGGGADFYVASTAPLYNVEVNADVSGTNVVLESGLTVENNLTISANATLNASSNDVTIGGDFTNNGTYTTGTNTTKFMGSGNSSVNGGTIAFSSLELDKEARSTEVILGTGTISVTDSVAIVRGTLNLNASEVNVENNIDIANGDVTGDYALVLNGADAQSLIGSLIYNPNFGRIELDNSNGASITTDIKMDYFTLSDGVLDIDKYRLTIDTSLVDGSGFGTSKMIETSGVSSARGVQFYLEVENKNYSSETIATYPVGADGRYAQVDVILDGNTGAAVEGYYTVIPVDAYHPAISFSQLDFYWKTESDISDINDDVVELNFDYDGTVPGWAFDPYYGRKMVNNTWEDHGYESGSGGLEFNENGSMTGFITSEFTAASGWNFLDLPQTLTSTGDGNWNNTGTWDGGALPRAQDFVIIQAGHTVTKPSTYNASAAKVTVNGTLNLYTTSTNDELTRVEGSGTIVMTSEYVPANSNFDDFLNNDNATFEYAEASNYNIPDEFEIYPNLLISGTDRKNLPNNVDILVRKNLTIDGNGTLRTNNADDLTIQENLIITNGGLLQINRGGSHEITVYKSIDLSGAGTNEIEVRDGGSNINTSILSVYENIVLSASSNIDLWSDINKPVELHFLGDSDSDINNAGANIELSRLVINKDVETATVNIQEDFNLLGPTNSSPKALDLQSGECHLNNSNIDINLTTGGTEFQIPSGTILRVDNGSTVNASGNGTGIWLDGSLIIDNSSVARFDGGSGTNNNYIEYTSSGDAYLKVSNSGELYVGSQVRRSDILDVGVLDLVQSGGTITLGTYSNTADYTSNRGVLELLGTGSAITQGSGDVITFSNSNGSSSVPSLYFDPETSTLDASSGFTISSGNTFGIYANKNVKNITVSGAGTDAELYVLPITVEGDLIVSSGTFDSKNFDVTLNGNLTNNGTFTSTNNTCYFAGSSSQTISGSGTNTFWNVEMNSGNDLILGASVTVSNNFDLLSGTLNTQTFDASIEGNLVNNGSTSTTSGNGVVLNGTSDQQEISGTGSFAVLTIDNSNGVVTPTQSAAINITTELKLEDGVFDIGRNLMVLSSTASFDPGTTYGGNYSTSNMVQTNLSFVDAGIEKYFPVIGGSTPFTYPIGSLGKYTPVVMDITSNAVGTGSIRVKAADEPHVSVPVGDQGEVLQYNWTLDADGISGFTADVSMYSYDDDAVGDTAAYVTGRILLGSIDWNKYETDDFEGYADATDISKFTFTNTDDAGIDGDYTAGGALPDQVQAFITVADGPWTTTYYLGLHMIQTQKLQVHQV